jgi:hypothetical protein
MHHQMINARIITKQTHIYISTLLRLAQFGRREEFGKTVAWARSEFYKTVADRNYR